MLTFALVVLLVAIPLTNSTISPANITRIAIGVVLICTVLSISEISTINVALYSNTIYTNYFTSVMQSLIFLTCCGCLVITATIHNINREQSIIMIFSVLGANILMSSTDILTIYLGIELQGFGLYTLCAIYNNPRSTSAGLKYFLLGALQSSIILIGIALIYSFTGTTSLDNISALISVGDIGPGMQFGIGLIFVGLLFKLSAAPFHSWAPDVYDDTPTVITTFLITIPKISYVTVIGIIIITFSSGAITETFYLLQVSAALSLIIGAIAGVTQQRIKRMLTYSTINHVGFLLVALSNISIGDSSLSVAIFYILQYTVTNLAAFIMIVMIGAYVNNKNSVTGTGNSNDISLISNLKGLAYTYPMISITLTLLLLSIAGVPPAAGFFAKYNVLYSLITSGGYAMAILAVVSSVISAVYYLGTISTMYFSTPTHVSENDVIGPQPLLLQSNDQNFGLGAHSYVVSIITLSVVLFGLYPNLILNSTEVLALY